jgi:hypothetical protein
LKSFEPEKTEDLEPKVRPSLFYENDSNIGIVQATSNSRTNRTVKINGAITRLGAGSHKESTGNTMHSYLVMDTGPFDQK